MPDLLAEIRTALGASQVVDGPAVHLDYTHDEALTAQPVAPVAVVFPTSTEEVAAVLRIANEHRVPVTARGSGHRALRRGRPEARRHRACPSSG